MARIKAALKNSLIRHCQHQKHVKCQPARKKKDEQAVQDLILCMDDFDADPFHERTPKLRSLQSGVIASAADWNIFGMFLKKEKSSLNISWKNECFLINCL